VNNTVSIIYPKQNAC